MKTERALQWAAYASKLAERTRLGHWNIGVSNEPCENHAAASVDIPYGRKKIAMLLSARFDEESAEDQRHTIVHELEHLRFYQLERIAALAAERMDYATGELFLAMHKEAMEHLIDELSELISEHLPLPTFRADA